MKKVLFALAIGAFFSVILVAVIVHKFSVQHNNNISIRVNDSQDLYRLYASYNRNKARKIQRYLDAHLQSYRFANTRLDATVTLDDNTNFYIKSHPGVLLIRLRRNENSLESYYRIKSLGEGIKRELMEN